MAGYQQAWRSSDGHQRNFSPVDRMTHHNGRKYQLVSDDHDLPLESLNINKDRDQRPRELLPSYGKPRRKKWVELTDIFALVGSLVLLIAAFFTVSPSTSTPWRLALTRQFQVIGFLLSAMNICFLSIAPKVLILLEARFGPSYLQNYDAILRNSFLKDKTNLFWRGLLAIITILPIALSLAYKEFSHGTSHSKVGNDTGNFYGFLPPAGLQDRFVGLTYFSNITVPFTAGIFDDPPFPAFPRTYGFNTLLLSETSSAKLDAPSPPYIRKIQNSLMADETYYLTADVFATVTSKNNSIEGLREDDNFWNYYLSQMHDPPDQYLNQPNHSGDDSKDSYLKSKLSGQDFYNDISISVLMNSFFVANSSWMFFCFIPTELELSDVTTHANVFRQRALLYNTRRESCTGTWRITYNSIELVEGACNKPPLSDDHQLQLTNSTLALPQWYMPTLSEYLAPFTTAGRNGSHWLLPATCTIFAGMYWSRIAAFTTVTLWSTNSSMEQDIPNPSHQNTSSDTYYHVIDSAMSSRRTMNASYLLYFTLAIYPILTTLFFATAVLLHSVPLDSGFGTIALLAGVRVETLRLLKGASKSGRLHKPIHVTIESDQGLMRRQRHPNGHNEYVLQDDDAGS